VDIHVVVWLAFYLLQLSPRAIAAIDHARNKKGGLAISDITPLELATLVKKGRVRLAISLESFLQEVESRFVVLPITARACVIALDLLPAYPSDPIDRIIGATALAHGLSLLTAKSASPEPCRLSGEIVLARPWALC
jgi:PIN domain nuclease of toxin-antitoxin system